MSQTVLLVDYENVREVDLSRIPANVQVRLFVGASQSKVPMDLVVQAQSLGSRLSWIRITGQGSNALDFHIAYYLAEYNAAAPKAAYIILSKDKGFDPLVKHLIDRGVDVRRVATQHEAFPAKPPASATRPQVQHVIELLTKVEKSKRPRKRASLLAHLKTHFNKKLSATEVERLVLDMFERKFLSEANDRLTYNF